MKTSSPRVEVQCSADAADLARRQFLKDCGVGLGKIALAGLLADSLGGGVHSAEIAAPLAPKPPHFAGQAKQVIHLFMAGAPSQLEIFDPKPELTRLEGKPLPPSVIGDQRYAFIRPDAAVMGPRFKFAKYGESGVELSEAVPHLAEIVDEVCFVRSVHTDQFNHAPAQLFFNTGFAQPGRPSFGSWVLYGLGAEAENLPAYVVMSTGSGLSGGSALWSSGFLPTLYTGVPFRSQGDPILDVSSPPGIDRRVQSDTFDLINGLNRRRLGEVGDPEIATRISAFEMAARLQTSAPELMDLRSEGEETLKLYGCDPDEPSFARACLLARRMIERGVRFVHVFRAGEGPQAPRPARRNARRLGRRVRPHADGGNQSRTGTQTGPRPSPAGLLDVAGRRRHQAGRRARPDRRLRLPHRRAARTRTRRAGHAFALPGPRPRAAYVPLRRPRLPPDRRARKARP
jgi:hypothetical protein